LGIERFFLAADTERRERSTVSGAMHRLPNSLISPEPTDVPAHRIVNLGVARLCVRRQQRRGS
jgi:hypothetical protein